jgi:acetolactate synthase-1/2/3 large subunit
MGAVGHAIGAADELLPTLRACLASEQVHVIACPVDYAETARLVERLGELERSL